MANNPTQQGILPGFRNMNLSGSIRSMPLSPDYQLAVSRIIRSLGPEYDVRVTSAGQASSGPNRTGSHRHDVDESGQGHTSDFVITRNGQDVTPSQDPGLYETFFERAAPVFPGMGHYDWGIHVGGGSQAFWGPTTGAASADPRFAQAVQRGRQSGQNTTGYEPYSPTATGRQQGQQPIGGSGYDPTNRPSPFSLSAFGVEPDFNRDFSPNTTTDRFGTSGFLQEQLKNPIFRGSEGRFNAN